MKAIPFRLDIVTRERFEKKDLLRFVVVDGNLVYDKNQDKKGKGVYLSPSSLEDKRVGKCFSRAFKTNITNERVKEAVNG